MNIEQNTWTDSGRGRWDYLTETENYTIHICTAAWDDRSKKCRVYSDGETPVNFTEAWAADAADGGPKRRGERPEVDKLFDRLNHQVIKNKRESLDDAIFESELLADLVYGRKLVFSRLAGCSCGCSAGFVMEGDYLYVTIPVEEAMKTWKGYRELTVPVRARVTTIWVTKK